ncbi:Predicted nucleic acid-binding protein, contains PIN domain [Roseateles sp. YR242]|uniref:PIN domain-containing protein n=1 Tax=Roseateles sp. YR242 TaxID=1855305 RepID=UPI0008CC4DDE|nr:PIN domain-containing protein [Roseateles sp. YR242]SEL92378.1 Predicted nucleic acid-binding protein, contains PIN domain [Roseateles sp. YR242]
MIDTDFPSIAPDINPDNSPDNSPDNTPDRAPDTAPLAAPVPLVILDTQIVMDWLVFAEPRIAPLIASVESRHLLWTATEAMKAEMLHVLGRGVAARYAPDLGRIDEAFARHCHLVAAPELGMARPRCSDPDDQKFIDLALACAARQPTWLISRDRAVLKVAKRARKLGLEILSPEAWIKLQAPASPTA